jgi:hypothetical protein
VPFEERLVEETLNDAVGQPEAHVSFLGQVTKFPTTLRVF